MLGRVGSAPETTVEHRTNTRNQGNRYFMSSPPSVG